MVGSAVEQVALYVDVLHFGQASTNQKVPNRNRD